jgi:ATPase subunit of ABC transporter with duplicated ATPase domains
LLSNPSLLLLDEPTNHLDIAALERLEGYLSHTRARVDRLARPHLFGSHRDAHPGFDATARAIREYEGNYTAYLQARERELEKPERLSGSTRSHAQLESAINEWKGHAKSIEQTTIHFHPRAKAKKIAHQAVIRQRGYSGCSILKNAWINPAHLGYETRVRPDAPSGQDVIV